jgi:hypothetical protein
MRGLTAVCDGHGHYHHHPGAPERERRRGLLSLKERFAEINAMAMECLPDSGLPSQLEADGYVLREIEGEHRRIIPNATAEVIEVNGKPVRRQVYAGIVETRR